MTSVGKRGIYPRREPAAKPPGFFVQRSPPARSPRPAGDRELHARVWAGGSRYAGSASQSRIEVIAKPTAWRARNADSRPEPALDLDVEGAHAMLHGLPAGVLGGDLRA